MPNLYGNIRLFSCASHTDLANRVASRLGIKVRDLFASRSIKGRDGVQ